MVQYINQSVANDWNSSRNSHCYKMNTIEGEKIEKAKKNRLNKKSGLRHYEHKT